MMMMMIKTQPLWLILITYIGIFITLKRVISLLKWVFITFIRSSKNLKSYGSWAIITGATDGIGKAFAIQLAEKGLNLILVGRNSNKLQTVSNEIQLSSPGTKIKRVVFDFSGDISAGVAGVEEAVKGLDVGILINNVGITYPAARYFHEVEESVWMNIVRVNLEGTTKVTRAVLKGMVDRKRGAIVNIGSGAAIVVPSHPLYAIYAATKAYVDQLSRCLYVEYKHLGIDVQCQVPLYVATQMVSKAASIEKSSMFIPTADDYARAGVRRIGIGLDWTEKGLDWTGQDWIMLKKKKKKTMELEDFTIPIVTAIGFISVLKSSVKFLRWVWVMFLRSPKNLKEYGSWAVVTGATDGIGKALAFELASKGLNLVLVGRNPSKLQTTSMEIISSSSSVEVKTLVVDLAKCSGKQIVEIIDKEIKGLDVGILVNNAGLAYPYPRFFLDVDLELMEDIFKVNMESATWMVLSVLPGMLRKKKGAILNIGSASSTIVPSYPLFTLYAATKAYFISSLSLLPLYNWIPVFVATKMTKLKESSIFIASPETYSKASVRSIGYEQICTPYWAHSLQWFIANALPDTLLNWGILSYFVAVNKVAKLKESKKKAEQQKTVVDESN
ncbi:hypothetical protein F8388_006173 [Cannabis sativa]|uniref:Uncharacterized protein n=1 Tax=Cannabis sativa TaxID=3483 RepID=A0A7J6G7D8_CANSA|nr:hypothetical protein F8388_006173 [Cannabis sativa]KAF4404876.1 hypothetical protein G4B88_006262 [Cannabis sativa]